MGLGSSQIVYSVELPNQQQPANSTKVRRHPDYVNGLFAYPRAQLPTMNAIVQNTFKKYPNNKAIGWIVQEKGVDQNGQQATRKVVKHFTYKQVQQKVKALGNAIVDSNFAPEIEDVPGLKMKFLGIFSKNRPEWEIVDITSMLFGYTIIPIYDTLGPENIPYVLQHSRTQNCFCSKQAIEILLKTKELGDLHTIISFDELTEDIVAKLKQRNLNVLFFNDLIKKGEEGKHGYSTTCKPDDCLTFSYTSGTTGPPKGAMLSHKNFASFCAVLQKNRDVTILQSGVYLSYLPLPHVLERICVFAFIYSGASIVYYSGDVQKLKDDLEVAKPTFFCSVPRLYNRFYDVINDKFNKTVGLPKTILDRGLSVKLNNVKNNGGYTHRLYDRLVFNKTKSVFGGNLTCMISGSAPLLPHIHSFMKVISCAPLLEGYGQTQSTGASFVTQANDPNVGHVGGSTSNIEYKLEDIPEMNYTHNDKDQQGRPAPRGQICMRGPGVFLGYYKDQAKTLETIDKDGWLHSGDIAVILPGSGALKIIDRKKNIFKLQQGQYVASEKVEGVYVKKGTISQIFLHGQSTENHAIAIIVPHKHYLMDLAKSKNIQGTFEELCQNKTIRLEVLNDLNAFSKKEGLQSFEQAKNIYLQPQPFLSKGILTNTMKLQRHEAKKVYKNVIIDLYKEGFLVADKK